MEAGTLLKIDDDYVKNTATEIEKWAAQLQTYFGTYQTCLENILSDAIMEGDTHDALESFKSYADSLESVIETLGTEVKGICNSFVEAVDEADEYIY